MRTDDVPPSGPGYYPHVPNSLYHSGPGVSKSQLDHLHLAPAVLKWSQSAPRDDDARAAVDIGDAFHAIALEPHRFEEEYTGEFVPPPDALVTVDQIKAYMDGQGIGYGVKDSKSTLVEKLLAMEPDAPLLDNLREQWAGELNGRTVLTASEYRKVELMLASAMAHPFARTLLEADGDVEPSIYWIDPVTGELCRCRPDKLVRLPNGMRILLDVKTTADIERFSSSIEDYRYYVQDPFYCEGYERHFGAPPDAFVFLVVSTQRSAGRYPVRCFTLTPEDKIAGANAWREDLNKYAECKRTGMWPGIETITRPSWARRAVAGSV